MSKELNKEPAEQAGGDERVVDGKPRATKCPDCGEGDLMPGDLCACGYETDPAAGYACSECDGSGEGCVGEVCRECDGSGWFVTPEQARAALAQPSPTHAEQAEGAQEVPSPVSQEYDRHLISLLRKGEALPGHQEEAADEIERLRDWNDHLNNTVLPNILNPNFLMLMKGGERLLDLCTKDGEFIGVSLNDMKDVFDWMVTHARIAPDQAALAQPSPASDLDPLNLAPHAEAFNEAPAEALKPEPAEADRPEVVARVVHSNPVVLDQCAPLNANDEMMTVAQHAASVARWAEMFNRVEQERDAALAEVERLTRDRDDCLKARLHYATQHGLSLARVAELTATRNRYGVDAHYFNKNLQRILRDFESFTPDELARSLIILAKVADEKVVAQHSVPELYQSRSALTEAQMRRLYEISTEAENERLGFAAFARLMRRAEAVHQIAAAPGKEVGHE
ncbi:hypothetical protein ACT517_17290 [Pseudomonas aeruginosa]